MQKACGEQDPEQSKLLQKHLPLHLTSSEGEKKPETKPSINTAVALLLVLYLFF